VRGPNGETLAEGPVWEGLDPAPGLHGQAQLYLADLAPGTIEVPRGSTITVRLYGEVGRSRSRETVSGADAEVGAATAPEQSFEVLQPAASPSRAAAGPSGT
jgi:hypothetical protein